MRGSDLKDWRRRNGYTQEALRREFKLRSRQTLVAWEQSEEISRLVELALQALERLPDTRQVAGERCRPWTSRRLEARELQKLIADSISNQDKKELLRVMMYEPLTGLYNRGAFLRLGQAEWERSRSSNRPFSVMLVDIDLFKSINDRFGHALGDAVLVSVANTCKNFGTDTAIVARIGGNEFVILVPETGMDNAHTLAEQLRQRIEQQPVLVGSQSIQVTVSVGVAQATPDIPDLIALLNRADQALWAAKRKGRNRIAVAGSEPLEGGKVVAA